jgi:hypothetical protein
VNFVLDVDGMAGALGGTLRGDRIEGTWSVADQDGAFVLTRVRNAASAEATAAPADPISGTWTGEAIVQGQAMPFELILKLTGDTVTGEISSEMGQVPLAGGTWKDATLLITFPYVGGEPVSMGAQIKNGRLEGLLDYNNGEAQGTWSAVRK